MQRFHLSRPLLAMLLLTLVTMLVLAACGGEESEPTPTMLPPTWTPTPVVSPTETPAATPVPPATDTPLPPPPVEPPAAEQEQEVVEQPPEPAATEAPAAEPTAIPFPSLVVSANKANLRNGPGTAYNQIGSVNQGAEFTIIGRNNNGNWWQIQVNNQPMWVFDDLVTASNAQSVQVAQNIPNPPARPTQPPTPPTNTPAPVVQDPCAGIGGDGCKFRVSGGPAFTANGGGELKLTLGFIHSGVDGGQAQGSYRVILKKNGAEIPTKECAPSWTGDLRSGPNGSYNSECKLGIDRIPDRNVAGHYEGWVIDGNHERDSQNFTLDIPDGQGEVWMRFDQG